MSFSNTRLLAAALLFVAGGCAHKEMTGEDHRQAAAADLAASDRAKAKFDPDQQAVAITPGTAAFKDDLTTPPRFYNPSTANLVEADRKMASAYKHLEAARKLESYEDTACAGLSVAQRTSCPLIAPHLDRIEEGSRGVVLHIKSADKAKELAGQLSCHLAFSRANNFERAPCPLFIKGVAITLTGEKTIEVASGDAKVAREVQFEARKMFGEPSVTMR